MVSEYYKYWDSNFKKILDFKATSGSHSINDLAADYWIKSQTNSQRQRAAKNLVNNTHYVDFETLFNSVEKLVSSIYAQNISSDEDVYILTDNPDRSYYFMSVIAVYFIRKLGYRNPIPINHIYGIDSSELRNKTLLIIDDMAYSGQQIMDFYREYGYMIDNKIKIIVGLFGITERARQLICSETPFILYASVLFPNLNDVLSKREFAELIYYFNPHGDSQSSIYFDHKIPDSVSIFTLALYGPILPRNLGYDPLNQTQIGQEFLKFIDDEEEYDEYKQIFNAIHEDDKESFISDASLNALYALNPFDNPLYMFHPFVQGCKQPNISISHQISYYNFITGGGYIIGKPKLKPEYVKYLDDLRNSDISCVIPFYKQGSFAMI